MSLFRIVIGFNRKLFANVRIYKVALIKFFIQYDPKYVTIGSESRFPIAPKAFSPYRPLVVIIKKGRLRLFHIDVTFEM